MAKVRPRINRPTGIIIAPPMPCSARAATSIASDCDWPHSAEATVNSAMAPAKMLRVPYLSAIQPLIGMKTARLNR